MTRGLRALLVAILAAGVALAVAGVVLIASGDEDPCPRPDFARWRQQSASEGDRPTDRQRIADDIVRCHQLIGLSSGEVLARLGRDGREEDPVHSRSWYVGPDDLQLDSESLTVTFAHGRAVRAAVTQG